jgi:hypothetical protein
VEEGRKKLEVGEDRHGGCERYSITQTLRSTSIYYMEFGWLGIILLRENAENAPTCNKVKKGARFFILGNSRQ